MKAHRGMLGYGVGVRRRDDTLESRWLLSSGHGSCRAGQGGRARRSFATDSLLTTAFSRSVVAASMAGVATVDHLKSLSNVSIRV